MNEPVMEAEEQQNLEPQPESKLDALAMVRGEPVLEIPKDLYIPPEAMEVFLEAFSGPLDLLLYLIKRNNLDILDIPIADITRQYMGYVDIMKSMNLELAGDYLVMAATLAEIKSRMLLPRPGADMDEDDPRAELVRRLQEYERFKHAAHDVDEMPRMERDIFLASSEPPDLKLDRPLPDVDFKELMMAFGEIMKRTAADAHHQVGHDALSVRERMTTMLDDMKFSKDFRQFTTFFKIEEGRQGVVVTFIAMLELIKESLVELVQSEPFAPIYLKAKNDEAHEPREYDDAQAAS
tara:strand:+ start:20452 stop:21333 length:882 start_codon:yes stop_codon:yes gene_type:complete